MDDAHDRASSDDEDDFTFAAPREAPSSSKRARATAAVAAAWRGSQPLERPEPKRRRSAPPADDAPAPAPDRPTAAAAEGAAPPPTTTARVANLPARATAALVEAHCGEVLGDDAAVVDARLVARPPRPPFAFVECRDAGACRRLVAALDDRPWLESPRLVANFARPRRRPGDPKPRRGLDYEVLAAHVDRVERERVETRARERREARDAWRAEHGDRADAAKAAHRRAGHFGHGFGPDGRPKLHSGYKDML